MPPKFKVKLPIKPESEPEKEEYYYTINEIETVAKSISLKKDEKTLKDGPVEGDGRIESAMKEKPFLDELKRILLERNPEWEIVISPPRASCDIIINSLRINLKLTDCKSADNSNNKSAICYSLTGFDDYPNSSNWNTFNEYLLEIIKTNKIKKTRNKSTEYHYLVKNKKTGEVLFKPIFDIYEYLGNPSNILQINWGNEFINKEYSCKEEDYSKKILELLNCIQTSVRRNYENSKKFMETNFSELLG